jgi:uncharacterized protein YdeI (YjbR/CyaY-like superfamily)
MTVTLMSPTLWAAFEKLPPSHKRQYVAWINSAKKDDTKQSGSPKRSAC